MAPSLIKSQPSVGMRPVFPESGKPVAAIIRPMHRWRRPCKEQESRLLNNRTKIHRDDSPNERAVKGMWFSHA